jgi:hypothetical protein
VDKELAGKVEIAQQNSGEVQESSLIPLQPKAGPEDIPSFIEPKADLIVGATGSGKTVNIGEVSNYVLRKFGKLTRLYGMDPGGYGPIEGLVKSGQVEYWPMYAWKNQIDAINKACHGGWPLDVNEPNSPIVPIDAGTYEVYGFAAYEGLTTFGDAILNSLGDDQAKLSQSPSFIYTQGDSTFSGGNESYYGFMQKELARFAAYTNMLRFEKVLWTALESKGKDQSGNIVYGPMIGGKQATGKAGAWFCNYFHMDILPGVSVKDVNTGQTIAEARHVLFLKTHIDPLTLIPFPCKLRAPKAYAKDVPAYLESGSVSEAYELLDKLVERQKVESAGKLSEITGLRERLLEKAVKAKEAEKVAAEKRAKIGGLIKPQVVVPAMPTGSVPSLPATKAPFNPAVKVVAGPVLPARAVTIQQVKK